MNQELSCPNMRIDTLKCSWQRKLTPCRCILPNLILLFVSLYGIQIMFIYLLFVFFTYKDYCCDLPHNGYRA
jgi:hypothetical protein